MKQDTSNHLVCKYGHYQRPVTNYVVCEQLFQLWAVCYECNKFINVFNHHETYKTLTEAEDALMQFKMFGEKP